MRSLFLHHTVSGQVEKLAEGLPISQHTPRLQRATELTCESTVKLQNKRFSSLLGELLYSIIIS